MQAKTIQQAPDPMLAQEQQQATAQQVAATQTQVQGDMASLMARYGTKLALSGMSPTSTAAPPSPQYVAMGAR